MQLARVIGTVVSTQKNEKLEGATLLLVQPLTLDDAPSGSEVLAIDGVGAGVRDKVLIVIEGRSAGVASRREGAPVDAAVVGIVDCVDLPDA
jgi:ethanolamine utilization protein EutN